MRARVGIWHDRVAVYFKEYTHAGYSVSLDRAHGVVVLLPGHGRVMPTTGECIHEEWPWRVVDTDCPRQGFARCALMDVDFRPVGGHSTTLIARLPANHLLPWPHARDCEQYRRAEELLEECLVRKRSARESGERMPAPPAAVQKLLTREMRVALFS